MDRARPYGCPQDARSDLMVLLHICRVNQGPHAHPSTARKWSHVKLIPASRLLYTSAPPLFNLC